MRRPQAPTIRRAKELKKKLIRLLGSKCVKCGQREGLEFDHINGRTWDPGALGRLKRMQKYAREIAKGLIQLLCGACNKSKGKPKLNASEPNSKLTEEVSSLNSGTELLKQSCGPVV